MTWIITHKPAYDTDFIELPKNLQKRASHAHAELGQDPITPRGNTIKPLKGWDNLWRYRLSGHRLGGLGLFGQFHALGLQAVDGLHQVIDPVPQLDVLVEQEPGRKQRGDQRQVEEQYFKSLRPPSHGRVRAP